MRCPPFARRRRLPQRTPSLLPQRFFALYWHVGIIRVVKKDSWRSPSSWPHMFRMSREASQSICNTTNSLSNANFRGHSWLAVKKTKSSQDDGARCRVAIVGAGNMAREHLRAFADVPAVVLSGIHSRTRRRAESLAAEFKINQVCNSIEELYEQTEADLVVVTVPELSMSAVSRACFGFAWT